MTPMELEVESTRLADANYTSKVPEVIAIDCEMVGGGSDESLDICARVCLVDEDENVVLHTYVKPQIPITNYRYEITGITEMLLLDAMPLKQVQEKILEILYNGESIWRTRLEGGKARLLVGHDLAHDLDCLRMCYPEHLLRQGTIGKVSHYEAFLSAADAMSTPTAALNINNMLNSRALLPFGWTVYHV
ncbi:hypothetical protein NE237_005629 [Protea cynaroides]|uniref:Exonuclease domain-containing protein n=1 Tax=Protea cynaroides TaxID=273540 RepID=A0A9Q0KL44_9MAGN|nr:hypothetical protein NE237_005629 [Protea cynaroides]